MKRTVSFLLSLVMIIGVLSTGFSAFAADETSGNFGDGLTWNFNSLTDTLSVSGTGSMGSFSSQEEIPWNQFLDKIEIVELENGVTDVGDLAFGLCSSLKKVSLPEGLKSIGALAFGYADPGPRNKLTEITIPSSVTSIGECAFANAALESIVIPNGVETIGDSAFYTETLKEVSMPIVEGISFYDVFYNPEKVEITSGNAVPNEYFYDDHDRVNSLKSVILPESITSIGNGAFFNCSSLTEITIPSSVTSIGDSAFSYSAVESILIPKSVETIGFGAFAFCPLKAYSVEADNANYASKGGVLYNSDCSKLIVYPAGAATSFEIPSGVTEIGDAAFYGCVLLTDVTIPNSVTTIGNSAFDTCKSLKSVSIPGTVTSIGDSAFSNCDGLTSIIIPESVTSIGDFAFESCDALANVTISNGVQKIGNYAFSSCDGLTSIVIPDSVTSIGDHSFSSCVKLENVTLSGNLTKIAEGSFSGCFGLVSIIIPESVTSIDDCAFEGCTGLTSITIQNSSIKIYYSAFRNCYNLKDIYFAGSPEEWRAIIISDADINGAAVHYSKPCGTHKYKWKYNNDSVYNSSSDYKNGTKTGTCIYCGATITEEAPNTALLRSRGNALVLENSITLATYITKDVVDYYDEVYAEFTRNGKTEKITASKEKLTSGSTVYYIFNYKGISPQAIGDDVSITFYGVKDGIVYCGNSYSYSVANYIKNTLAKSDTSDKLKTLLVDLVYYGEACQIYQNYKADKPLSNILTDEQKGYRSTGELNLTSVKHYEHDEQVDEKIKFAPALRLADSVQIAIAFKIPDDVDMSKIIVSACDSDSGWYDYTFKNNPENFEKGKDGYWYFYFDKLNANQLSKTYFFAIFTGDDLTDDSTWTSISALLYYSVESYAATVKNEKLKAVTDAMMRYGNSAKAYSSK
mgnify:CR=1 FL=1